MGFVSRAGTQAYNAFLFHNHQFSRRWIQRFSAGVDATRVDGIDGGLESQNIALFPVDMETVGRDRFAAFYEVSREVLSEPFVIYSNRVLGTTVVIPEGDYAFNEYGFNFYGGQQRRVVTRLQLP